MPASGVLRYPYEAITQTTDYLQIRIFKYQRSGVTGGPNPPSPSTSLDVSNIQSQKAKVLIDNGVIILPMPSNIQDSNSVSYDADSLNAFAATGVDAVQEAMVAGGKSLSEFLTGKESYAGSIPQGTQGANPNEKLRNAIGKLLSPQAQRAATAQLAISAVNVFGANVSFNSLLARSGGQILNPNMELLFNNVTLRTFRFSFKLAPRDPNEATAVKSIIRTLKKNMAAKKVPGGNDNSGIFLETPNIFKLTYRKGNQNHPFLHRFKDCALSDMNVQYTGDNVYATYADGTPVSMILNLTFKELLPIYAEDYDKDDDGGDMTKTQDQMIYGTNTSGSTPNNSQNIEGVGF